MAHDRALIPRRYDGPGSCLGKKPHDPLRPLIATTALVAAFGCGGRETATNVSTGTGQRQLGREQPELGRQPRLDRERFVGRHRSSPGDRASRRERPRWMTRTFPSTIGLWLRAAQRSAVLDRPTNPTRPESLPPASAASAPARRTPTATAELTAVAFRLPAKSGSAGVRTTSASLTRIVHRGRRASAVARLRTTPRMSAYREAIAPSTRTVALAVIARPRGRGAKKQAPIIATPHWTNASTTRTARPSMRANFLRKHRNLRVRPAGAALGVHQLVCLPP